MTAEPLVSVVVPAYNAEPYVRDAVDSIIRQTYRRLQIILVNDGSTDGSLAALDQLAARDRRIEVLDLPHRGLVPALNAGLRAAKGDLIARMDADDYCYPTRIARQVALHEARPELALSAGHVDYLVSPSRLLRTPAPRLGSSELRTYTVFSVFYVHPTVMLRRSVIGEAHCRYDTDYPGAEDFELFRRVTRDHEVAFVPEPMLAFRTNHTSVQSRLAPVCAHSTHRVVAANFRGLGIDVDSDAIAELLHPERPFTDGDVPQLSAYLDAGRQARDLLASEPAAAQAGFSDFASNLFEALALKGDLRLLTSVFRRAQALPLLRARTKILATFARVLRRNTALRLRAEAVRVRQILRARHLPAGLSSLDGQVTR